MVEWGGTMGCWGVVGSGREVDNVLMMMSVVDGVVAVVVVVAVDVVVDVVGGEMIK